MATSDHQSWQDVGDEAVRQVKSALSKIDLEGVASSIGKAVGDAARQLGLIEDDTSPYIIEDEGIERQATLTMGRGVALLLVGLGLVSVAAVSAFFNLIAAGVLGVAGVLSGVQGTRRIKESNHERRLSRIVKEMARGLGKCQRIALSELSRVVEVPAGDLEPYIRDAIGRGIIPQGRLDGSGPAETLYLTDGAWEQESHAREAARKEEERAARAQQSARSEDDLSQDAVEVLDAFSSFASSLIATRSAIADESVRASLDGIVAKSQGLMAYVRKHPETAGEMRKMVTYYLPTTEKLAASYAELEGRGTGEQAQSTRDELKETLTLVDSALAKLADNLLQEQSWDLKSDMDVMRTMLEQDGLS